ncbi:MAG: aspartate/glutamate racemase family protein [Gammaproteobacteria bacterium]|nr:aspartate/glutamate racemase family protein [Gammaproteobacteria bacterium]
MSIETRFIQHLPFSLDEGIAARASLGLIVLASDYTIEAEWGSVISRIPGVSLYHSRIPNEDEISPESLKAMEPRITQQAATLTPGTPVDVIAYGCTSASMAIGEERVVEHIKKAKPESMCTTPVTAAFAAFKALNVSRVAVLTPYAQTVNKIVVDYLTQGGIEIPIFGSFDEPLDSNVARIAPESIAEGVRTLVSECRKHRADIDAVFVSCTSVRLMDQCAQLEVEIGLPLTSSNHAMLWHGLRLAGIDDDPGGLGRLFGLSLVN